MAFFHLSHFPNAAQGGTASKGGPIVSSAPPEYIAYFTVSDETWASALADLQASRAKAVQAAIEVIIKACALVHTAVSAEKFAEPLKSASATTRFRAVGAARKAGLDQGILAAGAVQHEHSTEAQQQQLSIEAMLSAARGVSQRAAAAGALSADVQADAAVAVRPSADVPDPLFDGTYDRTTLVCGCFPWTSQLALAPHANCYAYATGMHYGIGHYTRSRRDCRPGRSGGAALAQNWVSTNTWPVTRTAGAIDLADIVDNYDGGFAAPSRILDAAHVPNGVCPGLLAAVEADGVVTLANVPNGNNDVATAVQRGYHEVDVYAHRVYLLRRRALADIPLNEVFHTVGNDGRLRRHDAVAVTPNALPQGSAFYAEVAQPIFIISPAPMMDYHFHRRNADTNGNVAQWTDKNGEDAVHGPGVSSQANDNHYQTTSSNLLNLVQNAWQAVTVGSAFCGTRWSRMGELSHGNDCH
jgi:hypothetical protein